MSIILITVDTADERNFEQSMLYPDTAHCLAFDYFLILNAQYQAHIKAVISNRKVSDNLTDLDAQTSLRSLLLSSFTSDNISLYLLCFVSK